jgi:hypothetical protein
MVMHPCTFCVLNNVDTCLNAAVASMQATSSTDPEIALLAACQAEFDGDLSAAEAKSAEIRPPSYTDAQLALLEAEEMDLELPATNCARSGPDRLVDHLYVSSTILLFIISLNCSSVRLFRVAPGYAMISQ